MERGAPALTGEVLPSMGRARGWAGLRAAARPCQQRGAEQGQLGWGRPGRCLASGLVRQCQQRSKPVGPARPRRRRFPKSSTTPALCRPARGPCERGRAGPREQRRPGAPLAHPNPLPPLCAPHSLTHPPAALLPGPAQGRGCTAVPSQENLAAVSHKSGIPCPRGNERLFPSGSSRGL